MPIPEFSLFPHEYLIRRAQAHQHFLGEEGFCMEIQAVIKAVKLAAEVLGAVATLLVSVAEAVAGNG